jgi:hypothetical protein
MAIDRRTLLGALGLGAAATGVAKAQEAAPAPQPSLEERITARAREHTHRLDYDGARFSGPGYDMLLEEGSGARFFCLGEEHGIAENPKLAAQLFSALTSAGYSKACVEISPPMAAELDRAARGGVEGLRALFTDPTSPSSACAKKPNGSRPRAPPSAGESKPSGGSTMRWAVSAA